MVLKYGVQNMAFECKAFFNVACQERRKWYGLARRDATINQTFGGNFALFGFGYWNRRFPDAC